MNHHSSLTEVAHTLPDGPTPLRRNAQRARALAAFDRRQQAAPRWRVRLAPLVAACIAIALVWLSVGHHRVVAPTAMAPLVSRDDGAMLALDAPLVAREHTVALRFNERSTVALQPGATGQLTAVDPAHVEVTLAEGALAAEITKGTGRRWLFRAGPYEVAVLGTKLRIDWSTTRGAIVVSVTEGRVAVTGPGLDRPRSVSAGESFDSALLPHTADEPDEPALGEFTRAAAMPRARAPTTTAPPPSWRQLLDQGHRAEALSEAKRAGVFRRINELNGDDALLLGSAARLEHQRALAASLLQRARVQGDDAGCEAAFMLGKDAATAGNWALAAQLFGEVSRAERSCPFVEDATGRLISVSIEQGETERAATLAKQYLARWPSGTWAALATTAQRAY